MSILRRGSNVVLAGLCVGLLLFAAPGWCEMVQAPVQPKKGEDTKQLTESVKKKLLQEALRKKALEILSGNLPAEKEKALQSLLDSRQKEFIRVAEVLNPGENGGLLIMDVTIDEQKLAKALQLSGIYYTMANKRPFQLDLQGAGPEDKAQLDALMASSGLEPDINVLPALKLEKEQGGWSGSLNTGYGQFSEQGTQLDTLWQKLWAHYFASLPPPHKEKIEKGPAIFQTLTVRGFGSPDRVYVLDDVFGKWKRLVAKYKLQKIDMSTLGIGAVWMIEVSDQQAFSKRLTEYIANSGLTFGWDGAAY